MFKNQKGSSSTAIIIIVVMIVILLVLALGGCGIYYWWKNSQPAPTFQPTAAQTTTQTSAPTTPTGATTQAQTTEGPDNVVMQFMKYTLGTIPGAQIDYEAAKDLVSYELAQQINSSFVPQAYCIQDGPTDIKVNVDSNEDNMVAYVTASATYGGETNKWDKLWEFEMVNGSDGWKIKYLKCLSTGKVTK